MTSVSASLLQSIAEKVGAPFYLYDAAKLRTRIKNVLDVCQPAQVQPRFAMKANSATRVLKEMHSAGIWIDAVSGNECLRALRAGYRLSVDEGAWSFGGGVTPPRVEGVALRADYAYVPFGEILGATHRFTVSLGL